MKARNYMELSEAEYIKKRLKAYIKLYKKDLNDLDNHNGDYSPRARHPGM